MDFVPSGNVSRTSLSCPQGLAESRVQRSEHFAGLRVALNELRKSKLSLMICIVTSVPEGLVLMLTVQHCVATPLNSFAFGRWLEFGELFFEVFDAFGEFGELDELEVDAAGVGGFLGGGAADFDGGGFEIHHDAGLGGDTDHVGDVEVTGDADLASHDDVLPVVVDPAMPTWETRRFPGRSRSCVR